MEKKHQSNRKIIRLPEDVATIIRVLKNAGYEAYAVGGCVRDSLLGRKPNDWDITTSARPDEVKRLFKRTIDTGIEHGTVTVLLHHVNYEVTTYRIDGKYEDNRHPKEVIFTPSLKEDLKRRDFTMNAMAYNEEEGLVDLFDGAKDLQRKVIRAVGDARQRFREDALRMMRAVRFAAQLGYTIEDKTNEAIHMLCANLKTISAERIQVELVKLLESDNPQNMLLLYETGITAQIFPEFDLIMKTEQKHPHHCYSVGMHTIHAMECVENDKILRLAMLFHDIGKPLVKTTGEDGYDHFHGHAAQSEEIAKQVLRRLKFDNHTIDYVCKLVRFHDQKIILQEKYVRRALCRMGEDIFARLLKVKHADVMAQSAYLRTEKVKELSDLETLFDKVVKQEQCFSLKDLALSGKDLISLGICPGPKLGNCLHALLEIVLDDPSQNTKEKLESIVKESMI